MNRPNPPDWLLDPERDERFILASGVDEFVRDTFLHPDSPLYNEEHDHLGDAHIGYLWTNVQEMRGGFTVAGRCEKFRPEGNAWQRARQTMQIVDWFGKVPDFIVTLNAPFAAGLSDTGFCAVLEHELLHAGQAMDVFGSPRFNRLTGLPIFAIRQHDVEEFVSIVERYGVGHAAGASRQMAEASRREPRIAEVDVQFACGSCGPRAL